MSRQLVKSFSTKIPFGRLMKHNKSAGRLDEFTRHTRFEWNSLFLRLPSETVYQ